MHFRSASENDTAVVLASDHLITDDADLLLQIKAGADLANEYIFAFGIAPSMPETGFGYISKGEGLSIGHKVLEFKEKPDAETAERYISEGYLWNSGMFMFGTAMFSSEVKRLAPEVYGAFQLETPEERFSAAPNVSIDCGIMEKTDLKAVLPVNISWSDLGGFASFYQAYSNKAGKRGNISAVDPKDDIFINSAGNLVYPSGGKIYALLGVSNLIVIDEGDALLIADRDHAHEVKDVVGELRIRGDGRADFDLTEYRPWGSYTILEDGPSYKIKKLTVNCGKQLSCQMHYHRSVHWVVVRGAAIVMLDGAEHIVRSNESIYISAGQRHRLRNSGKIPLEVIEAQCGEYLGEDDIVRFEDDLGRA
jgi:mannose-1-phosphate guanylyltransferase/mannose-6-phosphate isomerase